MNLIVFVWEVHPRYYLLPLFIMYKKAYLTKCGALGVDVYGCDHVVSATGMGTRYEEDSLTGAADGLLRRGIARAAIPTGHVQLQ